MTGDEQELMKAIYSNDVKAANAIVETIDYMILDTSYYDVAHRNNMFCQLVIKDDVEQLKKWLSRTNFKLDHSYIMSIIKALKRAKIPFNQSFRCLIEALIRDIKYNEYMLYFAIKACDEDYTISVLQQVDWSQVYFETRICLFRYLSKKNAIQAVKVLLDSAPEILTFISPCRVLNFSFEIINLMLDRGWNPTRGRSPRVLDMLADKLDKNGFGDQAQQLRKRTCKIVSNRLARELEQA